jgi:hypothetical protein
VKSTRIQFVEHMDRMGIGRTKARTKLYKKACRKEAGVREGIINVERKGFLMICLILVLILFF